MNGLESRNLVKRFNIFHRPRNRLIYNLSRGRLGKPDTITALDQIDFSLETGGILGIIGENGAGKSTLLRIMAGVLSPDAGSFSSGDLEPTLLQLGAGFHQDLTGEENARISAVLHGSTARNINKNIALIGEFSELGEFFKRPVRTYSQGMLFRLGFSIAAVTRPDLLLIDETLAVGDEYFKTKCFQLLNEFKKNGVTMAIASHDLDLVRHFTTKILVLEKGKSVFFGDPSTAVDRFLSKLFPEDEAGESSKRDPDVTDSTGGGSTAVELYSVRILDAGGAPVERFGRKEFVEVEIGFRISETVNHPVFGIGIFREDGVYISGFNHFWREAPIRLPSFESGVSGSISCTIESTNLAAGRYYLSVWCHDHSSRVPRPLAVKNRARTFRISDTSPRFDGAIQLENRWKWRIDQH